MSQEQRTEPMTVEALIYQLVGNYITRKVDFKKGKRRDDVKDLPEGNDYQEYNKAKEKIAKEAFFAVRARSGPDFINYFASTLFSVPQHITEESYKTLTQQLHSETDRIRILTLMALSAQG